MAAGVATATGNWKNKTASELREIGDKSLILSPILVFEHELNEFFSTVKIPCTVSTYLCTVKLKTKEL